MRSTRGRVRIDGEPVKPARSVKMNDKLVIDNGSERWEVQCCGHFGQARPGDRWPGLYRETEDSVAKRENDQEARRLFPEPGTRPSRAARPSTTAGPSASATAYNDY
jgi:ribosome-associated heat shock protein Hsp15